MRIDEMSDDQFERMLRRRNRGLPLRLTAVGLLAVAAGLFVYLGGTYLRWEMLVAIPARWRVGGLVIAVTGSCLVLAALVIAMRGFRNRQPQVPTARALEL